MIFPSFHLIVGKPRSGKSYLMEYIIKKKAKVFAFGLVFCPTSFRQYKYMPTDKVVGGYDEDFLKKWVKSLKDSFAKNGSLPHNFIIFDDIIGLIKDTSYLKNFLSCFRHYNTTVFIITQYVNGVPTIVRNNADYVYIFRQTFGRSVEALYESFGSVDTDSKKDFGEMIDKKLGDTKHSFCMRDMNASTSKNSPARLDGTSYWCGKVVNPKKMPSFSLQF